MMEKKVVPSLLVSAIGRHLYWFKHKLSTTGKLKVSEGVRTISQFPNAEATTALEYQHQRKHYICQLGRLASIDHHHH